MKYIIIADIHGKLEIAKHFLDAKYNDYHKVFVGDYVDSFDRSVEDQIECVTTLLKAVERDDVTALLGNHELSYVHPRIQCSGFNAATYAHMQLLEAEILDKFKTHLYLSPEVLVTHAGANSKLFETKEAIADALHSNDRSLYQVGYARGGADRYGGIFWNDFWREHNNIPELVQIMGHTAFRPPKCNSGIVERDGDYNIDCLDRVNEVLEVEIKDTRETFTIRKFECEVDRHVRLK